MTTDPASTSTDLRVLPPHFAAPLHHSNDTKHDDDDDDDITRMFLACRTLEFDIETRFVAIVLLHRWRATSPNTPFVTAACLLLASKQCEQPRRLRDMINMSQMIFAQCVVPPKLDDRYWQHKTELVKTEQRVLRQIGFDTSVSYPYRAIALILRSWDASWTATIRRAAFQRIHDALYSTAALRRTALELACASIAMSVEDDGVSPVKVILPDQWWHEYEVTDAGVEETKALLLEASQVARTARRVSEED